MTVGSAAVASSAIRVISWDVDGTLYSLKRLKRAIAWQLAGQAIRGRMGGSLSELTALRQFQLRFDRSRGHWDQNVVTRSERSRLMRMERKWYGTALRSIGPEAGVVSALSYFADRGFTQIVISDFESHYKLRALGLERFFSRSFSGESLRRPKPDPGLFLHAAGELGVPPSDILHIGDRAETDEEGARRAGASCLLVGRDFPCFQDFLGG